MEPFLILFTPDSPVDDVMGTILILQSSQPAPGSGGIKINTPGVLSSEGCLA